MIGFRSMLNDGPHLNRRGRAALGQCLIRGSRGIFKLRTWGAGREISSIKDGEVQTAQMEDDRMEYNNTCEDIIIKTLY